MFWWARQVERLLVSCWIVHHHAICGLIAHHLGLLVGRHVALGWVLVGALLLLLMVRVNWRNVELFVTKTGRMKSLQHMIDSIPVMRIKLR
jgi:hypothetical protein